MFENDLGEDALVEMEESDITGAAVMYAGVSYPCTAIITGFGGLFVVGGESPRADTVIYIRKSVLPSAVAFGMGQQLTLTRTSTGAVMQLQIKPDLGIRDLVFAWELTCMDRNERA